MLIRRMVERVARLLHLSPKQRLGLESPTKGQLLGVHRGRVRHSRGRHSVWLRLVDRQMWRQCHSCRERRLLLLHRGRNKGRGNSNRDGLLRARGERRRLAMNLSRCSCRSLGSKGWNLLVDMTQELLGESFQASIVPHLRYCRSRVSLYSVTYLYRWSIGLGQAVGSSSQRLLR